MGLLGWSPDEAIRFIQDYPGKVEEEFKGGLRALPQNRYLGAARMLSSPVSPFLDYAYKQAGHLLAPVVNQAGRSQQESTNRLLARLGYEPRESTDVTGEQLTAPIALVAGMLRGKVPPLGTAGLSGGGWYSRARKAVEDADQMQGEPRYWINRIGEAGGRKELKKTGGESVLDTIRQTEGNLSKAHVLGLLEPYEIELEETYTTLPERMGGSTNELRFANEPGLNLQGYNPGNPVEIQLSLPDRDTWEETFAELNARAMGELVPVEDASGPSHSGKNYRHPHWAGILNVLVHLRGNDGVLFGGEGRGWPDEAHSWWPDEAKRGPAFIVQELQSDWSQEGNAIGFLDSDGNKTPVTPIQAKGYFEISDEDWGNLLPHQKQAYAEEMDNLNLKQPPDMPYKKDWHELGFKRALMETLRDSNKKYLAWTTGEAQAKRNYGENWEVDFPQKSKFPLKLYNEKIVKFAKKFLGVTPQRYDQGKWVVFDPTTGTEIKYFDSEQEADDYTEMEHARSRTILDYEKSPDELWYIEVDDEMRDKFIDVLEEELGGAVGPKMPLAQKEGGGLLGRYA
jgi:hypothetical protein